VQEAVELDPAADWKFEFDHEALRRRRAVVVVGIVATD